MAAANSRLRRRRSFLNRLPLVVLLLSSACVPPATSGGVTPSATATVAPTETSPTAVRPSPGIEFSTEAVETMPLGKLAGDLVVLIRASPRPDGSQLRDVAVVDISGGPARVALRYVRRPGVISEHQEGHVVLARQLSPDRRQIVLDDVMLLRKPGATKVSDPGQPLLIADLETGAVRVLAIDGVATDSVEPAWSPSGETIAFARRALGAPSYGDAGLWVIGVNGQGLRKLADPVTGTTHVFGWTADGAGVAFGVGIAPAIEYRIVEVATGAIRKLPGYVESSAPAAWRNGQPAFAGVFTDAPFDPWDGRGGATRVAVGDAAGANLRTVFEQPADRSGRPRLADARWHPSAGRILVFVSDPGQNSVRIIDLASGDVVTTGRGRAARAEWAPSGDEIVYLVSSPPTAPISVTVESLDRSRQREILAGTFEWSVRDVATARYR